MRDSSAFPRRYRAIFLSDLHLGTRGCQAELVLDFLSRHEADTYFLVGDIIDGWRLKESWRWPATHSAVVRQILRRARAGARVFYIPGNHDEFARAFVGRSFEGIEIVADAVHVAADGRRYLVSHGDTFDVVVSRSKWLALIGDRAYRTILFANTHVNTLTRRLGLGYWSFSAWAKLKVKTVVNVIGSYERELAAAARSRGVDGVICGHIHHPTIRDIDGVAYINIGDFVESCSLVVEQDDGRLETLRWAAPAGAFSALVAERLAEAESA